MKRTITIVQEKCKTLILKLRSAERIYFGWGELTKPVDEIDQTINELGDQLTRHVIKSVNGIRDQVKKARPDKDDPQYQLKIDIYQNLLEFVTNLIKELTKVFNESLTNYRLRVEQLWNDLQATSDLQQIHILIEQFEKDSETIFYNAIEEYLTPHLSIIESKLNAMKIYNYSY